MIKDNQEIEIKIKINNRNELIEKVEALGGIKVGEIIDNDTYYKKDNDSRTIRLRKSDAGNFLGFKEALNAKKDNILRRTEVETTILDPMAEDQRLKNEGYEVFFQKEKRKVLYKLDNVILEFHTVPFLGDFLEIEEDEPVLNTILPKLDLSVEDGIPKAYPDLFEEYKLQHNLPDIQMTFAEEKKHHLQN